MNGESIVSAPTSGTPIQLPAHAIRRNSRKTRVTAKDRGQRDQQGSGSRPGDPLRIPPRVARCHGPLKSARDDPSLAAGLRLELPQHGFLSFEYRGVLDLEQHEAFGPGQAKRAGIQCGAEQHDLRNPERADSSNQSVVEIARQNRLLGEGPAAFGGHVVVRKAACSLMPASPASARASGSRNNGSAELVLERAVGRRDELPASRGASKRRCEL